MALAPVAAGFANTHQVARVQPQGFKGRLRRGPSGGMFRLIRPETIAGREGRAGEPIPAASRLEGRESEDGGGGVRTVFRLQFHRHQIRAAGEINGNIDVVRAIFAKQSQVQEQPIPGGYRCLEHPPGTPQAAGKGQIRGSAGAHQRVGGFFRSQSECLRSPVPAGGDLDGALVEAVAERLPPVRTGRQNRPRSDAIRRRNGVFAATAIPGRPHRSAPKRTFGFGNRAIRPRRNAGSVPAGRRAARTRRIHGWHGDGAAGGPPPRCPRRSSRPGNGRPRGWRSRARGRIRSGIPASHGASPSAPGRPAAKACRTNPTGSNRNAVVRRAGEIRLKSHSNRVFPEPRSSCQHSA